MSDSHGESHTTARWCRICGYSSAISPALRTTNALRVAARRHTRLPEPSLFIYFSHPLLSLDRTLASSAPPSSFRALPPPIQPSAMASASNPTTCAFCAHLPLLRRQPVLHPFRSTARTQLTLSPTPPRLSPRASLSSPFPLPDPFAFPAIAFTQPTIASDIRPELIGTCLWGIGLYLGFSQRVRWGTAVQKSLTSALNAFVPLPVADTLSSIFHTLPFLVAAFTSDAALRYFNAGSATWAVASGLSIAMYGGVYELGRLNARTKQLTQADQRAYSTFTQFAQRKLIANGRCHLIDIRNAIREDPNARRISSLSDETLRKFIRTAFPAAKRSPNGFYRGLSIRQPARKPITTP